MKLWWDAWPGRLEYEEDDLRKEGIVVERDMEAFGRGFVVIAKHVQKPVQREPRNLFLQAAAILFGLHAGHGFRHENFAQEHPGMRLAQVAERQHVGGLVLPAVLGIDSLHHRVGHELEMHVSGGSALGGECFQEKAFQPAPRSGRSASTS